MRDVTPDLVTVASAAALGGVTGWLLENAFVGPRFSKAFGGREIPYLPIYGAGAALVVALEPALRDEPWFVRTLAYGGALTALEGAVGLAERWSGGLPSWDYKGSPVSLRHALLWTALGMATEALVRPA